MLDPLVYTYDPWIKGPELKPVTNVTEILTMETNVDGYVAKTSWSPYFHSYSKYSNGENTCV